jgi:Na+-driven multidrug efflux pump
VERILSGFYFGLGQAAGIITGIELGKSEMSQDKLYNKVKKMLKLNTFTGLIATVVLLLVAHLILGPLLFPRLGFEKDTIYMAVMLLTIFAAVFPCRAFNYTMIVGVLRAGGDVKIGMVIELITLYCIGLPLAALLGLHLGGGAYVIVGMTCVEEIIKFVGILHRFRSRKWMRNVTRVLDT